MEWGTWSLISKTLIRLGTHLWLQVNKSSTMVTQLTWETSGSIPRIETKKILKRVPSLRQTRLRAHTTTTTVRPTLRLGVTSKTSIRTNIMTPWLRTQYRPGPKPTTTSMKRSRSMHKTVPWLMAMLMTVKIQFRNQKRIKENKMEDN